jgi:hypothetical protein
METVEMFLLWEISEISKYRKILRCPDMPKYLDLIRENTEKPN